MGFVDLTLLIAPLRPSFSSRKCPSHNNNTNKTNNNNRLLFTPLHLLFTVITYYYLLLPTIVFSLKAKIFTYCCFNTSLNE